MTSIYQSFILKMLLNMFSLLRYSTSAVHPKFSDATYVLSTMLSLLTFIPQIAIVPILQ